MCTTYFHAYTNAHVKFLLCSTTIDDNYQCIGYNILSNPRSFALSHFFTWKKAFVSHIMVCILLVLLSPHVFFSDWKIFYFEYDLDGAEHRLLSMCRAYFHWIAARPLSSIILTYYVHQVYQIYYSSFNNFFTHSKVINFDCPTLFLIRFALFDAIWIVAGWWIYALHGTFKSYLPFSLSISYVSNVWHDFSICKENR